MTHPYKIETIADLQRLSELASMEDFSIYLSSSTGMFDARTFLALLNFIGKEISLTAPDHVDNEKFSKFIEKLTQK